MQWLRVRFTVQQTMILTELIQAAQTRGRPSTYEFPLNLV